MDRGNIASTMEILLRFYRFYGWRIVEAADADGHRCRCLLLPMVRNGIFTDPDYSYPMMRGILCQPLARDVTNCGFVRSIKATVPNDMRLELIREGIISPECPDWSAFIGGVRPLTFASTVKRDKDWMFANNVTYRYTVGPDRVTKDQWWAMNSKAYRPSTWKE